MPTRFRFKGSAYAAAGVITTPFNEVIPTQASSTLAAFGGYGSAHSEDFRHRNIIRFDRAHSEVTGSRTHLDQKDVETYSTLVKASVEGLDIMGMITADRVVANLVSTYKFPKPEPGKTPPPHPEPVVKLIGSRFENLKIAGIPIKVYLAVGVLDKHHDHKSLRDAFKTNKDVQNLFGDDDVKNRHAGASPEVKEFLDAPPAEGGEMPHNDGVSTISIVRKLEPEGDAFESFGHVVHIEGFGVIRFGEVRICRHKRQLSMIQVRFGCPVEGDGSVGVVDGGGSKGN